MKKLLFFIFIISFFQIQTSFSQEIVAGSPNDFMIVRHYICKGSNRQIGSTLANIARNLQVAIKVNPDTMRTRLSYGYFRNNYNILYERMMGVADVYGIKMNDYSKNVSSLEFFPSSFNCSVVFYPKNATENQHNIFSRNMDMPLDMMNNGAHVDSRPMVFELYPDQGYPSICIFTNELLGGVVEGMNSQGLTVAVLGDETSHYMEHPAEPSFEVGFNELQCMRYILDECKNVEEAKESLLSMKHYYEYYPLHYIIADSQGKSFVFEFSRHRNQMRIVDGTGIQYVTNHVISNKDSSDATVESLERYNILKSTITSKKPYTIDEIKHISSLVSPWMPDYKPQWPTSRTLWHSIYDLNNKTVSVKFYLGETKDPTNDKIITKYSDYVTFSFKY
jgi:predicted choloylglycine hydrolase